MSSKAFNADTSFEDGFHGEKSNEDDQLSFISKKIRKMWRKSVKSNFVQEVF